MLSWRMMRFWCSASVAAHAMLKRYAGAAEQIAVRAATEAAGGKDAQEFWLGFDLLGPEVLQGYHVQAAGRRTRGRLGGGGVLVQTHS